MNKQKIKEIIKEMVQNGELDLRESTDVALSKNALIRHLQQEKEKYLNRDYKIFGFDANTQKVRDKAYVIMCDSLIEHINRGDFNKNE